MGQRFIARGLKNLDICCAWAETRRSGTLSTGQRVEVPQPNYWIPVPATYSHSPALRRHWAPASSTTLVEPPGYWSAAPSNGNAAPILERHWTPVTPQENRGTNHNAQTVTPGQEKVAPLAQAKAKFVAESMPAGDETVSPPSLSQTVTPDRESATLLSQAEALLLAESITASDETVSVPRLLSQTVTRLCVGCGQPLEGKRPQAKAHGAACRQRAYRRQKKAAAQAQGQREAGHQAEPQQADLAHITIG